MTTSGLLLLAAHCMAAISPTDVIKTDATRADAFGNISVTQPQPEVAITFAYGLIADVATVTYTGSGSSSATPGYMTLNVTGANGSAVMRSNRSIRYNPGQSVRAMFTSIFSPCVANSTQTIGIFSLDGNDGYGFGCNGAEFGIIRSSGGYHTWIASSSWNGQPFYQDITKGQVFAIQYQWLGFGRIEFMAEGADGQLYPVHTIRYANQHHQTSVFNPSLNLYAKVQNHTNTSALTLKTPSMGAYRSGPDKRWEDLHSSTSAYKAGISSEVPLLTVCSTTTYNGTSSRADLQPILFSVGAEGTAKASKFRIVRNATLTGAVYARPTATSFAMVDITASASSGGTELVTVWLGRSDAKAVDIEKLGENVHPGSCITVLGSTPSGTVDAGVSLHWDERF